MPVRAALCCGIAVATLVAGRLSAQPALPGGTSTPRPVEPYGIEAFGVFRDLMLHGDFSPKVVLGSVMSMLPSTGVGAVSGARGEISEIQVTGFRAQAS